MNNKMCHDWDWNRNLLQKQISNTPLTDCSRPMIQLPFYIVYIYIFNNNVNSYDLIIKKIRI